MWHNLFTVLPSVVVWVIELSVVVLSVILLSVVKPCIYKLNVTRQNHCYSPILIGVDKMLSFTLQWGMLGDLCHLFIFGMFLHFHINLLYGL
jgi:hypothetical protein